MDLITLATDGRKRAWDGVLAVWCRQIEVLPQRVEAVDGHPKMTVGGDAIRDIVTANQFHGTGSILARPTDMHIRHFGPIS
jgi:hypothetical protein